MNPITRTIKLRNRLADLDKIKQAVSEIGDALACTRRVFKEIDLVLEELFVNVVHYAFTDDNLHEITLRMGCRDQVLTIELEDDGRPFDITAAPETDTQCDIEERDIGGLGIQMVRHFTDHMEYRRENGKNILRVQKKIVKPCKNN